MSGLRRLFNPAPFWEAMRVRLATPAMATILGGPSRVRLGKERYPETEGPEDAAWGRIVIQPALSDTPALGLSQLVPWLVVAEGNDYDAAGYDVEVMLHAAQIEAQVRLDGWWPSQVDLATLSGWVDADLQVRVARAVYLERPPHAVSQWDEDRGLRFVSAEYRTELTPYGP